MTTDRLNRLLKQFPTWLIIFLAIINIAPFLAPLLAHYDEKRVSGFIYQVYSFLCHQKAHRSMHIYDEQCAWCMRDTFIWMALLATAVLVFKGRPIPGIKLRTAVLFALPMALDGGVQMLATIISLRTGADPFYESTNFLRAVTGSLFSLGVGLYLFPRLRNELDAIPPQCRI